MLCYVARRLSQMVPVLFGVTLLIYAMVSALPGDPIAVLEDQRSFSPEVIGQIKVNYHPDKPFIAQYLLYLKGLFILDPGQSLRGIESVLDVLVRAYPITIKFSLMALTFEAIAGISFGLIAGVRKGGWLDATVLVLSLVVIAVPTFVIGFVPQFIVGARLGWLSVIAGESPGFTGLLMPTVVSGVISSTYALRLARIEVAESPIVDHVRTARTKDLSGARVMIVYALHNFLIPVVTFLGADLGALMGGTIVTEGIFNIRGVGGILYSATTRGDGPMVMFFTAVPVLVFIVSNLLVDLLYATLDPRVRYA